MQEVANFTARRCREALLLPRLEADRERVNYWMSPAELMKSGIRSAMYVALSGVTTGLGAMQFTGICDCANS